MSNPKMIKTICGIDKYHQLKRDKSLWGKLRFTWFLVIATLRDLKKQTDQKRTEKRGVSLTSYNDFLNFAELDNPEFIQLLRDQGNRRYLLCCRPVLFYINYNIFNKFNANEQPPTAWCCSFNELNLCGKL